MTLLHLILWAPYPLMPVLWLKARLARFIAVADARSTTTTILYKAASATTTTILAER